MIYLIPFYFLGLLIYTRHEYHEKSSHGNSSRDPYTLAFLLVSTVIFFGYRDIYIGTDSYNYYSYFLSLKENDYIFTRFEPGFMLVSIFIAKLKASFPVYTTALFSLTLIPLVISARLQNKNIFYSFFLLSIFCQPFFWQLSTNVLRQGVAQSIFILGLSLLSSGRVLTGILFAVASALFHKSLIIFMPALFFAFPFFSKRFSILTLLSAAILYATGGMNALARWFANSISIERLNDFLLYSEPRYDWLLFMLFFSFLINFFSKKGFFTERTKSIVPVVNAVTALAFLASPLPFPDRVFHMPWLIYFYVLGTIRADMLRKHVYFSLSVFLILFSLYFSVSTFSSDFLYNIKNVLPFFSG